MNQLFTEATRLLEQLIASPSFSKEEEATGNLIQQFLEEKGIPTHRHVNNIWCLNKHFDESKPTILLNSHHDTVKPNAGYSRDPFTPVVEEGKLFGLGSNDAGGPLTSLIAAFIHFYSKKDLNYNLVLAATGEEEISGDQGIISILDKIPDIDCAIVGEPTQMRMAVAEKGLMVLECTARGVSGHAARDEGKNAIYIALKDIEWLKTYRFNKVSEMLGPVKMTTTVIKAGSQHNVVPDSCSFTVDVRSTDAHDNAEILEVIDKHIESDITARSIRLNPSFIPLDHPIVQSGDQLGLEQYGSPTLSDQSVLPVPSLKIGPGKSARSHTADEFIRLAEIEEGIATYIKLLESVLL
ncbi:M20 family metallo-hydrolase [Fodinibius sediminis]|uniref:Acetylornithine deacetylase n=1 Tax=Fodinibius sediminis TaxID=1214077 RepID=A0A521CAX1_9BACT|nr:M20 family metallo-hydrolase [Fodinibius sediminis]SMO56538.1 acetylornithine deacetylase [Fodinibius sediminis]